MKVLSKQDLQRVPDDISRKDLKIVHGHGSTDFGLNQNANDM
jgi:hypothetical protein